MNSSLSRVTARRGVDRVAWWAVTSPGLRTGACEDLTCNPYQVCSGQILGVGAEPESQRWSQDTVKKKSVRESWLVFPICYMLTMSARLHQLLGLIFET